MQTFRLEQLHRYLPSNPNITPWFPVAAEPALEAHAQGAGWSAQSRWDVAMWSREENCLQVLVAPLAPESSRQGDPSRDLKNVVPPLILPPYRLP